MLSKRKKILLILFIVVLIGAVAIKGILSSMESNLEALKNMEIGPIDIATIEDGTYLGKHSVLPISVEVNVTVQDHMITDIELVKHTNGQGKPAEVILEDVLEFQTLQVDAVSGATYSSKVILLAIESALVH